MELRKQAPLKLLGLVIALSTMLLLAFPAQRATAATVNLKKGSQGQLVKTVQQKLKNWGYYDGSVDGIFGSGTEGAVKYFQRTNGLTADGIIGPATAAKLGIQLANNGTNSSGSSPSQNQADVTLLARTIHGEARGEPYRGKVAVAAVILNRVKHAEFPNSVSGVVYQMGAFDAVADGQINLTPDSDAYRAAKDALNGYDPTNGCIYYYNPKTATNAWIKKRPILLTIGNHVFCK